MRVAFSTSWIDGDISRLEAILPYIDTLEVGTKGDPAFFSSLEKLVLKSGTPITSIHASAGPHKTSRDPYYTPYFISSNSSLRNYDIEQVALTAEWATQLGATAVIIHTGKVEDPALRMDFLGYKETLLREGWSTRLEQMKSAIVERRKELNKGFLPNLINDLRYLCRSFPKVIFCIETRVHYYEVPLPDEAQYIFNYVNPTNLGYWHDVGHTYILEKLGFVPQNIWQNLLGAKCVGTHLHDVDPQLNDHLPPGDGLLNFPVLLRQFGGQILHTLEIHSRHTLESVIRGIERIRNYSVSG
jgi:sugar phosphate isomerase/epimerase